MIEARQLALVALCFTLGCADGGLGLAPVVTDRPPALVALGLETQVESALPSDTVGFLALERYADGRVDTVANSRSVSFDSSLALRLADGRLWLRREGLLRLELKRDSLVATDAIRIHPLPLKALLVRPGAIVAGRVGGRAELEVLAVTLRGDTLPAASLVRVHGLSSVGMGPWLFVRDLAAGQSELRVSIDQSGHPLLRGMPAVLAVDLPVLVGAPR